MSLQRQFRNAIANRRHGFTLIELLVVVTIMLIIFSLTAGVVSLAINTDRIPSSARSIQAAVLGARDRALRAGRDELTQQPKRGVRLILNPNMPTTVSSLVYVGNQDDWTQGEIGISTDPMTFVTTVTPSPSWPSGLTSSELNDARIKILEASGSWYRLKNATNTSGQLTREYQGTSPGTYKYRLQLPTTILPNEQPIPLDGNVVINLEVSRINGGLPSDWYEEDLPTNPGKYRYKQGKLEFLFTPEGNVAGPLSASGPIYLYLCSVDDVLNNLGPADPKSGESLVIKFTPQTGTIRSFPVNPNGDPFKFAKQ